MMCSQEAEGAPARAAQQALHQQMQQQPRFQGMPVAGVPGPDGQTMMPVLGLVPVPGPGGSRGAPSFFLCQPGTNLP
jgi:hypothetical protein